MTRGAVKRDHIPPPAGALRPTHDHDHAHTGGLAGLHQRLGEKGIAVTTQPDIRWGRCDIKTFRWLLPNLLTAQAARKAGAFESLAGGR